MAFHSLQVSRSLGCQPNVDAKLMFATDMGGVHPSTYGLLPQGADVCAALSAVTITDLQDAAKCHALNAAHRQRARGFLAEIGPGKEKSKGDGYLV